MDEEQLKQALQEAFILGQRDGSSYGIHEVGGARKTKWDAFVQKWLDVLHNNGNCEGCDGACFSCPVREDGYK